MFLGINRKRLVAAWILFNAAGGTPVKADGYNVSSSITDNGVGDFTINFTTALPHANYAVSISARGVAATGSGWGCENPDNVVRSTTQLRFYTLLSSLGADSQADLDKISVVIHA